MGIILVIPGNTEENFASEISRDLRRIPRTGRKSTVFCRVGIYFEPCP